MATRGGSPIERSAHGLKRFFFGDTQRDQWLRDRLPWAGVIEPPYWLNKDGSMFTTLAFRAPDLESSTESGLVAARAQLNNALKRLGTRWCLHVEAHRRYSLEYPSGDFPDGVTWLIDRERKAQFEAEGAHYESDYYLTFTYLPPASHLGRAESLIIDNPHRGREENYFKHFGYFKAEVSAIYNILSGFMPKCRYLDASETLTYLHSTISDRDLWLAVPDGPFYLDALLCDAPVMGGFSPRIGALWIKTVCVNAFVGRTFPGLLEALNRLPLEYRWVSRYIPLDKTDAQRVLETRRRHWFSKRKGMVALMKEIILKAESQLADGDALNKALDSDQAMQELGADHVSYGYFTPTITVWDEDPERAEDKARVVQKVLDSAGFVSMIETFNAVDAWLGSLPANPYPDCRQALVSSLNLSDLLPSSAIWPGPERVAHLDGPPVFFAQTIGSTPFRFALHQGDVGHTIVVGPTAAGKSVLLNLIAAQFRRYTGAQVYIFDKGASCRATTLCVGGDFYQLGSGNDQLAFQPLGRIDEPSERAWAQEWLLDVLRLESVEITPSIKDEVWQALCNLAGNPPEQRTLTVFSAVVQNVTIRQALQPYTLQGPHGSVLDSDHDTLSYGTWQAFEMEELMQTKALVVPVLLYLFHRLEQRFRAYDEGGTPSLLVLDEAWMFLDDELFAARIREWLKVLRKKNVAVVFATQSLSDIERSKIAPAIIESCPTRIYLPNDKALEPMTKALYENFGLNDRQIQLVGKAMPKRDYYYQSAAGNRLFQLGLGPVALAIVGATAKEDQALMDRLLARHMGDAFIEGFLQAKGAAPSAQLLLSKHRRPQTKEGVYAEAAE
jgi:type IV secretion system protein VirB4